MTAPRTPPPPVSTCPVVQVKNFISAGSAISDSSRTANPISRSSADLPDPNSTNPVAYTSAAHGL